MNIFKLLSTVSHLEKKYSNNEQNCEYKSRSKQTSFISAFILIERKTSLFELQKSY